MSLVPFLHFDGHALTSSESQNSVFLSGTAPEPLGSLASPLPSARKTPRESILGAPMQPSADLPNDPAKESAFLPRSSPRSPRVGVTLPPVLRTSHETLAQQVQAASSFRPTSPVKKQGVPPLKFQDLVQQKRPGITSSREGHPAQVAAEWSGAVAGEGSESSGSSAVHGSMDNSGVLRGAAVLLDRGPGPPSSGEVGGEGKQGGVSGSSGLVLFESREEIEVGDELAMEERRKGGAVGTSGASGDDSFPSQGSPSPNGALVMRGKKGVEEARVPEGRVGKRRSSQGGFMDGHTENGQRPLSRGGIRQLAHTAPGKTPLLNTVDREAFIKLQEEALGQDHVRMLYLISKYSGRSMEGDLWVRKMPLMVFIYQGIVQKVFEYDYAPAPDLVAGRRVYLNISQEGRDDLDDLREAEMINSLKLSSKKYQKSVGLRITSKGTAFMRERLTDEDRAAVDGLVYAPGTKDLIQVMWKGEEGKFYLFTKNGYLQESTITEIESVSYVSSPYIPANVRRWGRSNASNQHRVGEMQEATSNIKDELDEQLTLDNVHLLIGEWIPMGVNQVVALNDKLGSSERVQGGFFTAVVDTQPDSAEFIGETEGLTQVDILDFEDTAYVNFEAEVHFPEAEGVVQVESFGVHMNDEGFILYGIRVDAIMHAVKEKLSLDNLSRLLVDVHTDSSKIVDNLLAPHQRVMLELTYLNDALHRDKYNLIMCERINPSMKAEKYMDKEANENELKQVIGDTHSAHDLSEGEVIILGKNGILAAGPQIMRHETVLLIYLSLMTRNLFMRMLFQRTFILADVLKHIRQLITEHEQNPNSIGLIRSLLSESSADVLLLNEIQEHLRESLFTIRIPDCQDDEGNRKLHEILDLKGQEERLRRRVLDMKKNINATRHEVEALRNMADVVSETTLFRVQEAVQANTKNLEDVFRANERASASLDVMQVILAGSLAFDMLDRLFPLYLGVAADLKWANKIYGYVYRTPGAMFAVNLGWWCCLGYFLMRLMSYISEQGTSVMCMRYTINEKIDPVAMHAFVRTRDILVQDSDTDRSTFLKKYSWEEADAKLWSGKPPKIELLVDERYHWVLKAFIQVNTKQNSLKEQQVKARFFGILREAGVINVPVVEGIEDLVDPEEELEAFPGGGGAFLAARRDQGATASTSSPAHPSASDNNPAQKPGVAEPPSDESPPAAPRSGWRPKIHPVLTDIPSVGSSDPESYSEGATTASRMSKLLYTLTNSARRMLAGSSQMLAGLLQRTTPVQPAKDESGSWLRQNGTVNRVKSCPDLAEGSSALSSPKVLKNGLSLPTDRRTSSANTSRSNSFNAEGQLSRRASLLQRPAGFAATHLQGGSFKRSPGTPTRSPTPTDSNRESPLSPVRLAGGSSLFASSPKRANNSPSSSPFRNRNQSTRQSKRQANAQANAMPRSISMLQNKNRKLSNLVASAVAAVDGIVNSRPESVVETNELPSP